MRRSRNNRTTSPTAQRFSSTIKWAAIGSDNYWSAYPGDGLEQQISFACNIHQLPSLSTLSFRQTPTNVAAYLPK
jgi:hypothetical protein